LIFFLVSDPHGYNSLMQAELEKAGFFKEKEAKLVILGDLLDRGGEAVEAVKFVMKMLEEGRLIYVRGNHEDLMMDMIEDLDNHRISEISNDSSHHVHNSTWNTALQLTNMTSTEALLRPRELSRRLKATDYVSKLIPASINYYETKNYVFVHGWLPTLPTEESPFSRYMKVRTYNAEWRTATEADWRRARWQNGMDLACAQNIRARRKTVVCGHKSASYGHANISGICSQWGEDAIYTPFTAKGIIAIDACTAYSGKMNVLRLED